MTTTFEPIADIPQYLFGTDSYLATPSEAVLNSVNSSHFVVGAVGTIVVALCYLAWVNHWSALGTNHSKLFHFLGPHRGNYDEKLELVTPSFETYLRTGNYIGFLVVWVASLASIRYFGQVELLRGWFTYVALGVALALLNLYQVTVIKAMGNVIRDKFFSSTLLNIKAISFNIFALVATPAVLSYALCRFVMQDIVFYIVAIVAFFSVLILIYESFLLFLEKKVSLLHTILYLCAVEIFPVTLIWGILCR